MSYRRASGWARQLSGVIAAALTPFAPEGELDLGALGPYLEFLLEAGVAGVMVGGTTGEFLALTTDERTRLVAAAVEQAAGRVPVIAHVGHLVLGEACALAEAAAAAGAPALAAVVPYFHLHSQEAIEEHLRSIARAVPELPLFVYEYPAATGNRLEPATFESLLEEPNVAGIKLSVGSLAELAPYLRLADEVCVVCGNDLLAEGFVAGGGQAVVSGNAAALPELVCALLAALLAGRPEDAERFGRLRDEAVALSGGGAPERLRQILRARGLDLGASRVRSLWSGQAPVPSEELVRLARWHLGSGRPPP